MLDFFSSIWQWILDIPTLISDSITYLLVELEILFYNVMTKFIDNSFSMIQTFTTSDNYLSTFQSTYGQLPVEARHALDVLNIPEAIILITGAWVSRFVYKLLPFT